MAYNDLRLLSVQVQYLVVGDVVVVFWHHGRTIEPRIYFVSNDRASMEINILPVW